MYLDLQCVSSVCTSCKMSTCVGGPRTVQGVCSVEGESDNGSE